MKKLITSLFVLMAIIFSAHGQTYGNYNQFKYVSTTTTFLNQDTAYVMIQCRAAQYQVMCSSAPGVLKAVAAPSAFAAGDTVAWRVIKGASIGTIPSVRFMNAHTGEFLYQGLNGGTSTVAYMAPQVDPNNGNKDFAISEQGTTGTFFCYYIEDMANKGNEFINGTLGAIGTKAISAAVGWKFILKQGPEPKPTRYAPTVALTTSDVISIVGGSINLDIQVNQGAVALTGVVKLYHNTTLVATVQLDANGHATYVYPGLIDGIESFTAAYQGDSYYDAENSSISVTPVANPAALKTKVLLTVPAASESNKDVKLSVAAQTISGDIVSQGNVYIYVNGIKKNVVAVDATGAGSVTFNNLLQGTTNIKAVYVGDKMSYLNSDTTYVSTAISASTSKAIPYPVYFDLCNQPAFDKWASLYVSSTHATGYSHAFPQDSVPGISMDSTKYKITYNSNAWNPYPTTVDNCFSHANSLTLPLGSGTAYAKWVNFKTPWLNAGSYNVYLNHRVGSTTSAVTVTDVQLDGKSCYFPNAELQNRWFEEYGDAGRRWNANQAQPNNLMAYLGTVNATTSDIHNLKISVNAVNYYATQMGMLQFIPVEMDSMTINQTAAIGLAKSYYPMFDLGGFARQAGETAVKAFADITALAVPYQVTDQTLYKTSTYVIDTLGNARTTFNYVDYVIVYRKDKWTRMAAGPVDPNTLTFSCDLPDGDYYYQELDYYDTGTIQGTGRRTFVKDGTFTVGTPNAINSPKTSNIKAYGYNKILTISGIKAGAKVFVTDLTGKILIETVSTSDVFTKKLNPGIYPVEIVSENEVLRTKVLVK